jgi:autotransporter-associated beta strand protein
LISIGGCLLIATLVWSAPAAAQDATWLANPTVGGPLAGTFDFNANANWNPATAPGSATQTGTATFGVSTGTSISFSSASTTLGGFTFSPGASSYTFTISGANQVTLNSAGIIGGTASSISFANAGVLTFANTATAGNAMINAGNNSLTFLNNSTAGSATINAGAIYHDNSTADHATINNGASFFDSSTAGNATINGGAGFACNGCTAGNATITNDSSGIETFFEGTSSAGNARLINSVPFARTDLSASTGLNNDNKLSAGSIEGGGNFYIGGNQLTVGGNNLSTTVSGVISDCGGGSDCLASIATFGPNVKSSGGSLVKTGSGTLTLSAANNYTGGTTINAGLINFNSAVSFGTGQITLNGGGLQWATGTTTDISSSLAPIGGNGGTFDTNSSSVTFRTALTGSGGVTKTGLGTLTFFVANSYMGGTTVNAGMINFNSAANFGTGQITLNGGGLQWATGTTTDISSRLAAIGGNGGNFDTNSNNVSFGTALTGSGSITKTGFGTLTFSVANSYTGATIVNGGTLKGGVANAFSAASATTINNGGTLASAVSRKPSTASRSPAAPCKTAR